MILNTSYALFQTGDRVSLFGAKYQRSLPKIMKDIFVPDHIIQVRK